MYWHGAHQVCPGRTRRRSCSALIEQKNIAYFVDEAAKAGLNAPNTFGGVDTKKFIIETTGTGVAIFDYDNDGWPDIFVVNGTTLDPMPGKKQPTNHLYHNNHDGTFTDVTEKKQGCAHSGWGQGVCVGDYDNDGYEDLFVTYYGKNVLYHNNGDGTFTDVSEKAHVAGNGAWSTGCAFVDYDRDGKLDLLVATYVDFDVKTAPQPGERASCMWKGVPVMCGPRGLPWGKNTLFHNKGDGTFEDVTTKKIDQQPTGTMDSACRLSILMTMAGQTFLSPATARRAFSITTITTNVYGCRGGGRCCF